MNILIIDDNKDISGMFSKYLSMKGFTCTVSNSGTNGLNLIKNQSFDRIILDISMPDFGGMDIIDALEKENLLKDNKILILTAAAISNEEILRLTKKEGIVAVLKKPVQLSELLQVILN
ncbi:MAG: response regulator [Nitrosarchaeum sp.]